MSGVRRPEQSIAQGSFRSFSQDLFNQKGDYGLSAYDRRHRFVATYIWDLPYVHNTSNLVSGVVSQITRGWAVGWHLHGSVRRSGND